MEILQQVWGSTPEGEAIVLYTIRNSKGCEVQLCNIGASIVSVKVPDRDGKIDDSRIDASVSDLVAGRKSGRDNDDQLTYTCNVGLGLYDVAIAARVYQYAKENGIGQKLKLWDEPIMV